MCSIAHSDVCLLWPLLFPHFVQSFFHLLHNYYCFIHFYVHLFIAVTVLQPRGQKQHWNYNHTKATKWNIVNTMTREPRWSRALQIPSRYFIYSTREMVDCYYCSCGWLLLVKNWKPLKVMTIRWHTAPSARMAHCWLVHLTMQLVMYV